MSQAAFPDKASVLKLAELIQTRLAGEPKTVNPQVNAFIVAQREEIQRRLTEALLRLQEAARGVSEQILPTCYNCSVCVTQ